MSDMEEFGQQVADSAEAFLRALQAISLSGEEPGAASTAIPLLLLDVSQIMLTGARLGAQVDFEIEDPYQPDVGPDPDLDAMRLRLADVLGDADTYRHNFEPYAPSTIPALLSDDLTSMASDIANGLRHFRAGNLSEALWWWQFSYLASWGTTGCGVLSALHSVVAHDRMDTEIVDETEQLEAAAALDAPSP